MAASEKLKALVGDFWENEPPEGPEAPEAVIAALPQLLAVVEAAEALKDAPKPLSTLNESFAIHMALSALEEALDG